MFSTKSRYILICKFHIKSINLRELHSSIVAYSQIKPIASLPQKRPLKFNIDGPGLDYFINMANSERLSKVMPKVEEMDESLSKTTFYGDGLKVKFITYGCQMNINDVELVRSLLLSTGYAETDDVKEADIVLLMTCSIREGAENKVWDELKVLRKIRRKNGVIGVLGCMAERIRHHLLTCTENVDVVAGPDSYRDLPRLLAIARCGSMAINVQLSLEETYADIAPVRKDKFSKTAFVSIMRGCDNMCSYCVVPYTRGRERSRPMKSILDEIRSLSDEGVKQVTLLGQNVNSYRDLSEISFPSTCLTEPGIAPGFRTKYKPKKGGYTFLTLLDKVSQIDPEMRIRFTSPHPKDFPLEVMQLIKERSNICKQIHLPAQSGSNVILEAMDRGYSRESYLELVDRIKTVLPSNGIRPKVKKTKAYRHLKDNVPKEVKNRRHQELASVFRETALKHNEALVGSIQLVLLEEASKRSSEHLRGRIDGGVSVIIHKYYNDGTKLVELKPGDYVAVKITSANSQTLQAFALHTIKLKDFENLKKDNGEKQSISEKVSNGRNIIADLISGIGKNRIM